MRYDPIHETWVSIAEKRSHRPHDMGCPLKKTSTASTEANSRVYCPFCEGHEAETPSERDFMLDERTLDNYRKPNSPGWLVRAVPNRYPFVQPDGKDGQELPTDFTASVHPTGPYLEVPDFGMQEVLADVPRHVNSLSALTEEEFHYFIHFYRRRLHQIRKEHRWKYAQLLKNQGVDAGASLSHTHSQIVALPFVPMEVVREQRFLQEYFEKHHACYHCVVLDYERQTQSRIVTDNEYFTVFCPFASRFPYEMHVLPKLHTSDFVQIRHIELDVFSELLRQLCTRLETQLGIRSYNLVLHNTPWEYMPEGNAQSDAHFHWRMEILPRVTKMAGYEFGTGCYVNPVPPERAAQELRFQFDSP